MVRSNQLTWTTWSWTALAFLIAASISIGSAFAGACVVSIQRAIPFLFWAAASPLIVYVTRRFGSLAMHALTFGVLALAAGICTAIAHGPAALLPGAMIYVAIVASESIDETFARRNAAAMEREEALRAHDETQRRLERSRIPRDFLQATFDDLAYWIDRDAAKAEEIGLRCARELRGMLAEPIPIAPTRSERTSATTMRSTLAIGTAIAAAVVASVLVQFAERRGVSLRYLPWASLRAVLAMVPAVAMFSAMHARGRVHPIALACIAVPSAIAGEIAFFSILALMGVSAVPPLFSSAAFAIAFDSVALPSVTALSLLLCLERLLAARDVLRETAHRAEIEEARARAYAELLANQLRPHFLFNALNSLLALLPGDRAASQELLARLRQFYAKAAAIGRSASVPIEEELALASEYLDIERVRFGPRLTTTFDVAPEARGAVVPSLLLQPLVENAIKHGIARRAGAGFVSVHARRDAARVVVEIRNSSPAGAPAATERGFGLRNTLARLETIYGRNDLLDAITGTGGDVVVRVAIPA